MEQLRIVHTNDLHSHFENWPKIQRFIHEQQRTENVLTVDLGDFCDRWHPLTESSHGQANIVLMNQANYDVATIGNNEGIGNSYEQLSTLYQEANFPVAIGNLFCRQTGLRPNWASPYEIVCTTQGTKVAFIGLTAQFPLSYEPLGWEVKEPVAMLASLLQEVRAKADVIVVLSHLGLPTDREIAELYPEIALIIGSHTHHLLSEGEFVNEVQLAAAGKFGEYVGIVDLTIVDGKVIARSATVQETAQLLEEQSDHEVIEKLFVQGEQRLAAQSLARLPERFTQEQLINETLQAMKETTESDVAFVNSGLFLTPLTNLMITKHDLHKMLPHPMRLLTATMTGQQLKQVVREIETQREELSEKAIKGMGFRGKIFGEVHYLGLVQPIDEDKRYQIVTVDHLMFLPYFPTIATAQEIALVCPQFLRHILAAYLSEKYPL